MNTNKLSTIILVLLSFLFYISCDKMNDIHQEYVDRGIAVYLGKADSLTTFSGFDKVKLTWYVSADPKVQSTIIYWNMREDSIIKPFVRNTPGIQKDSIIIENLPENDYTFEFRNVNSSGMTSLYSAITGTSWGNTFKSTMRGRTPEAFEYDFTEDIYKVNLSSTFERDGITHSEIEYTGTDGKKKLLKIDRDSTVINMQDFPAGEDFKLRTVFFFPEKGIDSVYTEYAEFGSPKSMTSVGKKVHSGTAAANNDYFTGEKILMQRNPAGDIIFYEIDETGQFAQTNKIDGFAPWTTYRKFFFVAPKYFIGVTPPPNNVASFELKDGEFKTLNAVIGNGFGYTDFIPSKQLFYGYLNGILYRWILNAAGGYWTDPKATPFGKGVFADYYDFFIYDFKAVLAVDNDGLLWKRDITPDGSISTIATVMGKNWKKYKTIIPFENQLLGIDDNGDIWLHDLNLEDYWVLE